MLGSCALVYYELFMLSGWAITCFQHRSELEVATICADVQFLTRSSFFAKLRRKLQEHNPYSNSQYLGVDKYHTHCAVLR